MFGKIEDVQKLGKQQFDAITTSASILSKGVQEIATEASEYSKKHFEASQDMFTKLLETKSPATAIEMQTAFAKTAFEGYVAQVTKMGKLFSNLAKQTFNTVVAKESAAPVVAAPMKMKAAA